MRKFAVVLVFILGFFAVFAISGLITFMVMIEDDDPTVEEATEALAVEDVILPKNDVIDAETAVTRVTPSLRVEDAIIEYGIYGEKKVAEDAEIPEVTEGDSEDEAVEVLALEDEEVKAEEKKPETKTEKKAETKVETKAEEPKKEQVKKEEVKVETPKVEEPKAEEVKVEEPKVEEPKAEEVKVEEPKVEEPKEEIKVEEPKEEEKPQLNPNIQTSDSGL